MRNPSLKIALMLALPVGAFFAGVSIMSKMSNRERINDRLRRLPDPEDRKPLNQRIAGYDADEVTRHWGALDRAALRDEQRALEADLVFPLAYGASFLSSLLMGWESLGRPFPLRWLLAPVGLVVAADWTENSAQLLQLQRFMAGQELQPRWLQIASAGTAVKLVAFSGLIVYVAALAAAVAVSEKRAKKGS